MRNIFCLLVNLFSGRRARQRTGEPGKTMAVYSPQGLSPEFTKKYGLSNRQAEVTGALLQGKSDKEIAALLDIALNTVQTHLKHIYRKTGVRGRYALMALVGLGR